MGTTTRILVVDDEEGAVETLGYILEAAGFTVTLAVCGEAAKKALDSAPFDLVLLDIIMPDADGMAMAREIRLTHPQTAVILMTGYYADRAFDEVESQPGIYLMHKPLPMADLLAMCLQLGGGSPAARMPA